MPYAHGIRWNEDLIKRELSELVTDFNLKVFPTSNEIKILKGNHKLSSAIYRRGGTRYWAEKMKLPIKKSETSFGQKYEEICCEQLKSIGYEVEKMSTRFPYDLTANKHIKIDVKVARLYRNYKIGSFYTFNLEKKNPTCDIYICYCLNEIDEINKVYVVPSKVMYGKKQLAVGEISSMYDVYKDNWDILKIYDNFYKQF